MTSPYHPPRSTLAGRPHTLLALRRRGAINFAVAPLVLMLVFKAALIYMNRPLSASTRFWRLLGPIQFFLPIAVVMSATGFFVARQCAIRTVRGASLLGCRIGLYWAVALFIAILIDVTFASPEPMPTERLVLGLTVLILCLSVTGGALCALTSRQARTLGYEEKIYDTDSRVGR